ncbi:hypothetical protein CYPRO_2511 [Cyclonatronum proteinivorum]|uniref:PorV/PorQ family protein n=2 Tax=Cyclonatronum proteinivorum TaxID=1457365 RepID=A0A345UMQ1_9BACT|nr:hypothetical protein CYPRO_2509 [Cyclonatronum proteinivorum]AXJ01753.1 hypothetical protein CYPRO_2511 [Cyclonatronum proteinivorum]
MRNQMNTKLSMKRLLPAVLVFTVMISAGWLSAPQQVQGQEISKSGTSAAEFLNIPVGTRATGVGNAITASVNDATAMYWNPGALAMVRERQVHIEHSEWFADLRHNFVGIALPIPGAGTVGLSVSALTMDDMEETTMQEQDGTGRFFGAYSYAAGLTYSQFLMRDFAIGATVKYVHEQIWNSSSGGFAFDLGTTYVTPFDGIRFGVRFANFGQKLNITGKDLNVPVDIDRGSAGNNPNVPARLETKDFDLPLLLQVGLAWDGVKTETVRVTLMADGVSPSNNTQSVNLGIEAAFFDELFAVQAGLPDLLLDDRMFEFAAGGWVNYELSGGLGLNIGYALQSHKILGVTNRFSLKVKF